MIALDGELGKLAVGLLLGVFGSRVVYQPACGVPLSTTKKVSPRRTVNFPLGELPTSKGSTGSAAIVNVTCFSPGKSN
jgi:hypothetical protein